MNSPLDTRLLEQRPVAQAFTAAELAAARVLARARACRLVEALEDAGEGATGGGNDEHGFVHRLAATVHLRMLSVAEMHALKPAFELLPYAEALPRECLLLREGTQLLLVIADPFSLELRAWASERLDTAPVVCLAHRGDIAAWFTRHEESMRAMDGIVGAQSTTQQGSHAEDISLRSISEDASPVVRLVNSTLYDALKAGVSDIHMETAPNGLFIKYRIDGVLAPVGNQGMDHAEQIISRIKVMAELDIAERRVPQDGRFKVAANGREIDIRVSIMPSIHGEDAVLRILDKQSLSDQVVGLRLEALGFDAPTLKALRALAEEPYGMLLATGPTGSGKTTTLYAALNEINHGHDKIITIEDPVEYQLAGVLQIPVNEKKGLTFARGLRSILRHDPDKIMVGEIRDGETAQIAVQAALTGHLVLTTVHANNVFDVLGRFTHMGVDPYSLVAALNGIVAQRLMRTNCPECVAPAAPDPELLAASEITNPEDYHFCAGMGCAHCRGTGFKGRKAVAEVLILDDVLREMIVTREPVRRIKEEAIRKGTRLLRDAGLDMVRRGETTLQELNRVVS
ncbi:general secretion pathway protein GspE [Rhodoferax lacus]|uniref:General secretion pathway protein GspE n=1 Tax=Rhodoferax lacus TaxID=2184758 RepID=A0A3E1R8U4_9BURK|nr:GspE/PulE family protein [Rhodoferax lacus]RFO95789.1 general secretion pathway protein GspE [Rhodoferax lacus]